MKPSKFEPRILAKRKLLDVSKAVVTIRKKKKINSFCRIYDVKKLLDFSEDENSKCFQIVDEKCILCDKCDVIVDNLYENIDQKCGACGEYVKDEFNDYTIYYFFKATDW